MTARQSIATDTLLEIFTEEITAHSGVVSDTVRDETRLFARSILSAVREVRPDDKLQGGVALRATETEVWLHPYVFRTVCSSCSIVGVARRRASRRTKRGPISR